MLSNSRPQIEGSTGPHNTTLWRSRTASRFGARLTQPVQLSLELPRRRRPAEPRQNSGHLRFLRYSAMDADADNMLVSRIMIASFHLRNRGLRRLALLDTEICVRWRETVCGSEWRYHGQLPEVVKGHFDWHPARCDAQLIIRGEEIVDLGRFLCGGLG